MRPRRAMLGVGRGCRVLSCRVPLWPAKRVSIATGRGFDGGGAGPDGHRQYYKIAPALVVPGSRLLSRLK